MIYIILSGIIGGLLNRLRGGWAYDSGINLTHGTLRIILALFSTCCLYLPFWFKYSFSSIDYLWFFGVFFMALFFGLIQGWGSWMEIGRNLDSYKHNKDWIISEVLARWVYGDKNDSRKSSFEWRRNREYFAMGIRGVNITLFAPALFATHLYFEYSLKLYEFAFLFPLGYYIATFYEVGYYVNFEKWPKWCKGTTHLGEVLTGSTIMSSFLMLFSWICLNY